MTALRKLIPALVAVTALVVSASSFAKKPDRDNIVDVATANGNFGTLLLAASLYPDIDGYLRGKGQRTVFAPDDEAFGKLAAVLPALCFDDGLVAYVLDNPDYIADVLLYHVAKGRKDAGEVLPADQIRMLNREFLTREPFTLGLDNPFFTDANITTPNVFASNGVIHVIDQVLLPTPPPSYCPPHSE